MHRFYSSTQNISQDKIILCDREELHHLRDVLRLKINKAIMVFDDLGNEYLCRIKEFQKDKIILEIRDKKLNSSPNKVKLTIACAIPKKSKFDDIIDKLTQLGVDRIIPLQTERVIVKLDKMKKAVRLERWKKIALSAVQQSQRNTIPVVSPIKDMLKVLSETEIFDLKLIPTLEGRRVRLKEVMAKANPKNILVFIGPEGDFTPAEVEMAIKKGCIPVDLGTSVLRVDTAVIAVASFIRLYANN